MNETLSAQRVHTPSVEASHLPARPVRALSFAGADHLHGLGSGPETPAANFLLLAFRREGGGVAARSLSWPLGGSRLVSRRKD
jgi:hypothetical protein